MLPPRFRGSSPTRPGPTAEGDRHRRPAAGDPDHLRRDLAGRDHRPGRPRAAVATPRARAATPQAEASRASRQVHPVGRAGHAEIFSDNLNTSTHYGEDCFSCHTVGFNTKAANSGIDDASDLQRSSLRPDHGAAATTGPRCSPSSRTRPSWPTSSARTATARRDDRRAAHGPARARGVSRGASLSVRPLRHLPRRAAAPRPLPAVAAVRPRQLRAGHRRGGAARAAPVPHRQRLPGVDAGAARRRPRPTTQPRSTVTWTADEIHPQTCQTCHDPHDVGTTSGTTPTRTVRINGDSPMLLPGFVATDVGKGAICITCHNTRRGLPERQHLRRDLRHRHATARRTSGARPTCCWARTSTWSRPARAAPTRNVADTCVTCHMEKTDAARRPLLPAGRHQPHLLPPRWGSARTATRALTARTWPTASSP